MRCGARTKAENATATLQSVGAGSMVCERADPRLVHVPLSRIGTGEGSMIVWR